MRIRVPDAEQIDLLRGGSVVSSFAGAFGGALRETRLTALLGYLIALEPKAFALRFGFQGTPLSVSLESVHEKGRSDILVETTQGVGVIEAKVNTADPFRQSKRYPAKWRVLVTEHIPKEARRQNLDVRYFRWKDITELLMELKCSQNRKVSFVSRDLITYLEDHGMIKKSESVEVYARDLNEPKATTLFLDGGMYGCPYKEASRLNEADYFAPCFGQHIAEHATGTHAGISYIAKIDQVEVVECWEDFMAVTREIRSDEWVRDNRSLLEFFKRG